MSRSQLRKKKIPERQSGGKLRATQAGTGSATQRVGRRARAALAAAAVLTVAAGLTARAVFVRQGAAAPVAAAAILTDTTGLDPQFVDYATPFIKAARSNPADARAHATLGLVCSANELWPQAVQCYESALQLGSTDPLVSFYLAIALQQMDDYSRAESLFEQVAADRPAFFPAWQRLGLARLNSGDFENAADAFGRIVAQAPSLAAGHAGLGACRVAAGNFAAAVAPLEKAVTIEPAARHTRYLLGLAYRGIGRTHDAKRELAAGQDALPTLLGDDWSAALQQHDRTLSTQVERALSLLHQGKPAQAVALLESVHQWHPENLDVLNNLASACSHAGDQKRARDLLERALLLEPNNFPAWINLAATDMAEARYEEALVRLDRAVELAPRVAHPRLIRGRALIKLNRPDDALASLQSANELDATSVEIHAELYTLYFSLGRYAEAKPHCLFVAERHPELLNAQLELCRVNLRLGLHQEADAALQRARRVDPRHPDVEKLAERLASATNP